MFIIVFISSFEYQQSQEYMLGAEFKLPSVAYDDGTQEKKAPIRVKFEIPYYTLSGIQVYIFLIEGAILTQCKLG